MKKSEILRQILLIIHEERWKEEGTPNHLPQYVEDIEDLIKENTDIKASMYYYET